MGKLTSVLTPLQDLPEFRQITANLQGKRKHQSVYGLGNSQKSFLLAGLWNTVGRTCLYITPGLKEAYAVYDDLLNFLPADKLCVFPAQEILPHDFEAQGGEIIEQRLRVLKRLLAKQKGLFVIAPVTSLLRRISPPDKLRDAVEEIRVGDIWELGELLDKLVWLGYERVELVEAKGQFAARGSIVDIFPMNTENPFRLEFFDNEIDSIREFATRTQRSEGQLEKATVFPAREMVLKKEERRRGIQRLREEMEKVNDKGRQSPTGNLKQKIEYYLEAAEGAVYFNGIDNLAALFYSEPSSFLEYFPREAVVVLDEPLYLAQRAEASFDHLLEYQSNLLAEGRGFPWQLDNYLSWRDLTGELEKRPVISLALFAQGDPSNYDCTISLTAKDVVGYRGNRELVITDLERWKRQRYTVLIFASTAERQDYLHEYLKEGGTEATVISDSDFTPPAGGTYILPGIINKGFELQKLKLVILAEKDIIGQQKVRFYARGGAKGKEIRSLTDLEAGQLVVHVNHGIGRYMGINNLEVGEVRRDYLLVQYAGEDRLYVPTDQLQLLQKYVGVEGQRPRLNKLGSSEWNRVKTRVKKSVQELAQGLIKLYALRESAKGHAFSADTPWQKEFEDSFPYEETQDQKEAIDRVKELMEEEKPMEHLVCGDVGYGKTEVAVRATFKAVMDGKQVAILVPTTILAQQHYNTFRERFSPYPVKIGLLSRFRTAKEQRLTLQGIKNGTVDIVIGTHRLLQQDIKFKELGLLVIDEEQRFGVGQKEGLKRLRENVDVLTLTATPIPRTLHMALAGIRDMSLIETPPRNRYPVQTYVMEHDYDVIKDAISQEIHRGGQAFYVHNRVETIQREAARLQELLPEARIGIGHGQMGERELEEVIQGFIQEEFDVLVCTTIIENGLDMPNVNTLIVSDADRMGLAQLYQLRGRVGRSERVAYAYFTYQKKRLLPAVAQKRLQALREFTELGSGFKLALRDLEIRGAGNLLGAEQHGHIANIGFELYCSLLEESVKELKGEVRAAEAEPSLDLDISAYLPGDYIVDGRQKVDIYKAIAAAKTLDEVEDLQGEIRDRFGPLPKAAGNLLQIAKIKAYARKLGIESIMQNQDKVIINFITPPKLSWREVYPLLREYRRRVMISTGRRAKITVNVTGLSGGKALDLLLQTLAQIAPLVEKNALQYNQII